MRLGNEDIVGLMYISWAVMKNNGQDTLAAQVYGITKNLVKTSHSAEVIRLDKIRELKDSLKVKI